MPTYFASPSGTATFSAATNPLTPCGIDTAISSAIAGDTVFIRGGNYVLPTGNTQYHLATGHAGTSGAKVLIKKYQGEIHKIIADGLEDTFYIRHPHWTFDGLVIESDRVPDTSAGIFSIGDDWDADYTTIQGCNLWLKRSDGRDNISCIRLQSDRADYALIQNNIIRGQGRVSDASLNSGVNYLGGGNIGSKILNNEIYDCLTGVYVKHANNDQAIGAAEIAYNYIHDCYYPDSSMGSGGIYGNPIYIHIHDNITDWINLGDNGGGDECQRCYFNHNTVIVPKGLRLRSLSDPPGIVRNNTFLNSIFAELTLDSYQGSTEAANVFDYNMYGSHAAIGNHDLEYTTPTYTGGSNPTAIVSFALATGSPGKGAGSDGKDIGADVALVGPDVSVTNPPTGSVSSNPSPVAHDVFTATVTGIAAAGTGRILSSVVLQSGSGSISGTESWTATCTNLVTGSNPFTVRVADDQGLYIDINFTITRLPVPPLGSPNITKGATLKGCKL